MNKYLILLLIICFWFLLRGKAVFAVDLSVICNGSNCIVTPGGSAALFNENKILPGQSFSRTVIVQNTSPNDDCSLALDTYNESDPRNLTTTMFTVIKDGARDIFGVRDGLDKAAGDKNLRNLFDAGKVNFGPVPKLGTKTYQWTATMNPLAGNEYQRKRTKFDFDLSFACGAPPALTPTPTLVLTITPTPTPIPGKTPCDWFCQTGSLSRRFLQFLFGRLPFKNI